jgi:hypothetical protein
MHSWWRRNGEGKVGTSVVEVRLARRGDPRNFFRAREASFSGGVDLRNIGRTATTKKGVFFWQRAGDRRERGRENEAVGSAGKKMVR